MTMMLTGVVGRGEAARGSVGLADAGVVAPALDGTRFCAGDFVGLGVAGELDLTAAFDRPASLASAMTVPATRPIPLSDPSCTSASPKM